MTTLHERFEAIKAALHNAINLADPEAAVREAEEAFKASIVAEVAALHERLDALTAKLEPAPFAIDPAAAAAGNSSGVSLPTLSETPSAPAASLSPSVTSVSADPVPAAAAV